MVTPFRDQRLASNGIVGYRCAMRCRQSACHFLSASLHLKRSRSTGRFMTRLLLDEGVLILVGCRHDQNDVVSSLLKLVGKLPKGRAAAFVFVDLGLYDTQVDAVVGIETRREARAGVTGKWGVLACVCLAAFPGEFTSSSSQFNAVDGLFRRHRIVL